MLGEDFQPSFCCLALIYCDIKIQTCPRKFLQVVGYWDGNFYKLLKNIVIVCHTEGFGSMI